MKQQNNGAANVAPISGNVGLIGDKHSFKEKLTEFSKTYGYLAIAMAIPAFIFFLIYLVRGLYPFGNGTVLVLDLNGQYVYFFEALRNTVLEGGTLLYSWSRALGGEFLGLYAYYLASPLSYLVCLFPKERTQEFLLILFMLLLVDLTNASAPATAPLAATKVEVMQELSNMAQVPIIMQAIVFLFMRAYLRGGV